MSWHVAQAFPTPVRHVIRLLDMHHVVGDRCFPKNFKPLENAFIGEMKPAVAVSAVLLDGLLEGTLLRDVSLLMAVVTEVVATSASKERTLDRTSTMWGQGHPVFGGRAYWGIGDVCVSNLLQCLCLFHPSLHSFHLHVNHE